MESQYPRPVSVHPASNGSALRSAAEVRVMHGLALMEVSASGRVGFSTQKARSLLGKFFPETRMRRLPESAMCWLRAVGGLQPPAGRSWAVQQGDDQLVVRLTGSRAGHFQLLLEERSLAISAERIDALARALALTPREAEVLLWIARGKTCMEIATILDCKRGTVNKHTERIFTKLSVETRTAAAAMALEIPG